MLKGPSELLRKKKMMKNQIFHQCEEHNYGKFYQHNYENVIPNISKSHFLHQKYNII